MGTIQEIIKIVKLNITIFFFFFFWRGTKRGENKITHWWEERAITVILGEDQTFQASEAAGVSMVIQFCTEFSEYSPDSLITLLHTPFIARSSSFSSPSRRVFSKFSYTEDVDSSVSIDSDSENNRGIIILFFDWVKKDTKLTS